MRGLKPRSEDREASSLLQIIGVGNIITKQSKVREIFAFVVWASLFPPLPLLALTWLAHGSAPFVSVVSHVEWVGVLSLLFQVYVATHFCYWGWNVLLREYPVFGVVGSMLMLGHRVGASEAVSLGVRWPRLFPGWT